MPRLRLNPFGGGDNAGAHPLARGCLLSLSLFAGCDADVISGAEFGVIRLVHPGDIQGLVTYLYVCICLHEYVYGRGFQS